MIDARDPMNSYGLGPWMSPNHMNLYCLVTSMAPKPYKFIGFRRHLWCTHRCHWDPGIRGRTCAGTFTLFVEGLLGGLPPKDPLLSFGPQTGPKSTPNRPQTTPTGPRTISNCSHMSCSHIHRSPTACPRGRGFVGREFVAVGGLGGGRPPGIHG